MVDKRADAAAAYAKAPKPPQADEPGAEDADAEQPLATPEAVLSQDEPAGQDPALAGVEADDDPAVAVETQTTPPEIDPDSDELVEQDLDELAARAQMADEYLVLAQRTQADFENYRRRAARDATLAGERGVARLAKELLPALDSLDRAVQVAAEAESQLADGVKLVHADLAAALSRVGIEPFSPVGEPFNPQLHEAVAQNQVDGVEPGTVVEVFQQGYRQGEVVLRPARVLVAA